jgi:hypothetical protein
MSLARRQAVISLIVWTAILVGMVIDLSAAGLERFSDPGNHYYRGILAGLLLPGLALTGWLEMRQRRARRAGELDERDEQVARRASEFTLIVLAIVVFTVGVVLWEVYKGGPGAPAAWFYVLAYATVVLLSLIHAAARLICDLAGSADA